MSVISYANMTTPYRPGLISALFASGEPGAAYDLTDASLLYQDSARTTLVAANGDPIGSVTDLSGNAKHASQGTTASKPLWQGYGDLDGVDDSWVTPSIDFTATDAMTVVVGMRKGSDATTAVLVELGPVVTSAWFVLSAPSGTSSFAYICTGTGGVNATAPTGAGAFPAPTTRVITAQSKISTDLCSLRVDGAAVASSANDQGTGNYRNAALYIGRRGGSSAPFNGRIYRMIVIGRALTATELANAERWCAAPAGVVLP